MPDPLIVMGAITGISLACLLAWAFINEAFKFRPTPGNGWLEAACGADYRGAVARFYNRRRGAAVSRHEALRAQEAAKEARL